MKRKLLLALVAMVAAFGGVAVELPKLSAARRGTVIFVDDAHRVFQLLDDHRVSERYCWDYGVKGPQLGDIVEARGVPRKGEKGMYDHALLEIVWRSWWNSDRMALLNVLVAGALFASVVWVLMLRRLVRRRTAALMAETRARLQAEIEKDAVARERLRLSYDLHDDLQQLLAGTMARLKAGLNYLGRQDAGKASAQFAFARQSVAQTQTALRHILWGLHDESRSGSTVMGLFAYVAERHSEWRNLVSFTSEGEEREVSHQISGVLLMIMQEAVGNAIRHGGATRVSVKAAFSPRGVALTVSDNGAGFDPAAAVRDSSHLGLTSMRLRAEQLGGKFSITSTQGVGACVRVTVPTEEKQ